MARLAISALALAHAAAASDVNSTSNLRGACIQVLCSSGSVLVDADSRGCGGRCEELQTNSQAPPTEIFWEYDAGYCMSVDDNAFRKGQRLQLWECSGSSGQMFEHSSLPQTLIKVAASPKYCVVIDGNKNYNGAHIQLWECDANNLAQQWIVEQQSMIRNAAFPDKCLVVDSNRGTNGQHLQLWSCEGSEQFKTWGISVDRRRAAADHFNDGDDDDDDYDAYDDYDEYDYDGESGDDDDDDVEDDDGEEDEDEAADDDVDSRDEKRRGEEACLPVFCSTGSVLVGVDSRGCGGRCKELPTKAQAQESRGLEFFWKYDSNYCMSVDDNTFENGKKLQLWKCSGSSGQYFDYSQRLLKVAASPKYCVVIDGNKDYDGAHIQLWECDASNLAQQWTVDSSSMIRNAAFPDKCLVVDSNKGADGQKLQLWSCEGSEQYKTWGRSV